MSTYPFRGPQPGDTFNNPRHGGSVRILRVERPDTVVVRSTAGRFFRIAGIWLSFRKQGGATTAK